MEFKRPNKLAHRSVRKVDAVVTGLILWGIIASIYGLEKYIEKPRQEDADLPPIQLREGKWNFSRLFKMLLLGVPPKEEKPSFFERVARMFRKP